ncbi:MAG: hypothetical protein ACK5XZ_10140 [Hyphomonadaceae bacterium]|jgi:hypothetical protein|uniref:hypothetical protein n=1 Tax=Aquidulcibacter sp. TaxID=2052990 RepID=UPI0022C912CB|nr:hypothetical protein [Aquidulcibacter sp.]MCE2889816.1 hypothetical protein [Hyphomonadaceae bacterium]MCZ8209137.1 hypothetical protein [Aquidulcibacter sp.]
MILHASISATDPKHVAHVLAELWEGEALPFAPVAGAWIAMAGDMRGSGIEVYPNGRALIPGADDAMFDTTEIEHPPRYGATHLAIQCHRRQDEIEAIAQREGWRSVRCSRGGMFDVIEFWIENATMIEVLTSEMQRDYQATSSIEAWREAIGHMV